MWSVKYWPLAAANIFVVSAYITALPALPPPPAAQAEAELVGERREDVADPVQLHRPAGVQPENIGPGHQHIDLIYFARPRGSTKIHAVYSEDKIGWYGSED